MCCLWGAYLKLGQVACCGKVIPHMALIKIPRNVLQAEKARKELEDYEERMAKALAEWEATRKQMPQPTQEALAIKWDVKQPTLTARINGRPSKMESAKKHQLLHPNEEQCLVEYLQETARRGFPDTRKRCIRHANEILCQRLGNPKAAVGKRWLDHFLLRHHDQLRCYWSTSLTTVRGGALNEAVVDDWFELLDATITNYGIEEDCIFSMDETCCFLDKSRTKGRHIGPANQVRQMILRNEARETVTMIPLISANGAVFPPTIIFKGERLRKGDNWDNPLNAM